MTGHLTLHLATQYTHCYHKITTLYQKIYLVYNAEFVQATFELSLVILIWA